MMTVKINQLVDMIEHVAIDLDEPLMIWGPPGAGKSEAVAQVTAKHDAIMVDIRLSQYDSVDLRGFPSTEPGLYAEGNGMAWAPPVTLPFVGNKAFPTDRSVILFLDEINSASPSVAAVAYQLINDRRVGEHVLMPNVRIVAAGNREGDRGVTNKMPLPLANRMTHVEVMMDNESWINYHLDNGGDPIFAAFFMYRPALICTFDPARPAKAFGTYRSWSKAAKYYASAMPHAIKVAAITGAVGEGEAAEFLGFVDIVDKMPDLDDIIKRPTKAALPDGVGMSYAVSVSLSSRMSSKELDDLTAIDTYLRRIAPEFHACAWTLAVRRDNYLLSTPLGAKFGKEHVKAMA